MSEQRKTPRPSHVPGQMALINPDGTLNPDAVAPQPQDETRQAA